MSIQADRFVLYGSVPPALPPGAEPGCIITGVKNATAPVPGQVGEIQSAASATYANFTTTATYQQLATVALTPGAYLVIITITTKGNGATLTSPAKSIFALATATAAATGAVEGDTLVYREQNQATQDNDTIVIHTTLQVSALTNYFLNGQMAFSAGNPQFVYSMRFVRIR